MNRFRARRRRRDDTETALANFALTFAKALLVICVMLFVFVSDDAPPAVAGVKPNAELMIFVEWPTETHADVDTWVRTPEGDTVWFRDKERGIVFLDRDDLGNKCVAKCEEIVSIRGFQNGDYVVNLFLYTRHGSPDGGTLSTPIPVQVRIVRINPSGQVLWESTTLLNAVRQEQHVVRFTVRNRDVVDFNNNRPVSLTKEFLR